ncbi:MAG: C-terminal helicase domain-containing protein [Oscillibacter sp.]|nr:C-terminal helicase domain-containing protein [Oscillibacter sp.]
MDSKDEFPPIGDVNTLIKRLTLCVYSPLAYLLPEKRAEYSKRYDAQVGSGVFKQIDRESSLVNLMRVGILKRMESSIHSFALTVDKILRGIDHALSLADSKMLSESADVSIGDIDLDDPELEDLAVGKSVKVLLQDMDLIRWKDDLLSDRENLERILRVAREVTPDRDEKLSDLKKLIANKVKNPLNDDNQKLVIFSAFADTANYLYANLMPFLTELGLTAAVVTGSGDNKTTLKIPSALRGRVKISDLNTLLTLFSPRSKNKDKIFPDVAGEIDVLIATDCISEGQNLQDCDYLVNYDIHWNPVRIIQRFGRIDRIGSTNQVIQLVNFWPMRDLDEYINLQQRVQGRMVLLDVSATGEENVIDEGGREMKDLEYRRKQLKSLQNQVVDLEDISGGISITDMTFNDFKTDLMGYLKDHKKELAQAPAGMYAVAQIPVELQGELLPGVIFTLRQMRGAAQTREQNALFPYYLLYVTQDGEVKLSFLHAKKILDYYKKLCSGQSEVFAELAAQFNAETQDGSNMKAYSALLEAAIQNLIGKKQEMGVASLFSKGGTTMQKEYYDGIEDFELISFLVLK